MTEHWRIFHALHDKFMNVAREVFHRGGHVCFEWPTGCTLWENDKVMAMIEEFDMRAANFNGCRVGLKSSRNMPICKPWTVRTTARK